MPLLCQNLATTILFYQLLQNIFLTSSKRSKILQQDLFSARKHEYIKPLLQKLHSLPIVSRIQYKVATLCYSYFTESYPVYLSELLTVYHPSRQLRSISDTKTLRIPFRKSKTFGQRAFSFTGPDTVELVAVWYSLLSINIFQASLKISSLQICI